MANDIMTLHDISIAPIEDIARFLIIAPEKAKAMQAEIRAIKKLGVAKEIYEQKQEELRMVNELVLDAKVRMGQLTMEIPKTTGGKPFQKEFTNISGNTSKTKSETIKELGLSKDQSSKNERLAKHPELVEQEKQKARDEGRMPSQKNILDQIKRDAPQRHYNGGGSTEYRKQREEVASIVAELYDETPAEFTLDDLIAEIQVNAGNYIRLLTNQIKDNALLIKEGGIKNISDVIDAAVIQPIQKIKEAINEQRA